MSVRRRNLLCSKYMRAVCLRPCPLERAFPGLEDPGAPKISNGLDVKPLENDFNVPEMTPEQEGRSPVDTSRGENSVRAVVDSAVKLTDVENMEYLWRFYANFLDRVLFYFHVAGAVFIFCLFFV